MNTQHETNCGYFETRGMIVRAMNRQKQPSRDRELMEAVHKASDDEGVELIQAWERGWNKADTAAKTGVAWQSASGASAC
jgi:hypothetical protein